VRAENIFVGFVVPESKIFYAALLTAFNKYGDKQQAGESEG
jgi:hypothetical protein